MPPDGERWRGWGHVEICLLIRSSHTPCANLHFRPYGHVPSLLKFSHRTVLYKAEGWRGGASLDAGDVRGVGGMRGEREGGAAAERGRAGGEGRGECEGGRVGVEIAWRRWLAGPLPFLAPLPSPLLHTSVHGRRVGDDAVGGGRNGGGGASSSSERSRRRNTSRRRRTASSFVSSIAPLRLSATLRAQDGRQRVECREDGSGGGLPTRRAAILPPPHRGGKGLPRRALPFVARGGRARPPLRSDGGLRRERRPRRVALLLPSLPARPLRRWRPGRQACRRRRRDASSSFLRPVGRRGKRGRRGGGYAPRARPPP